MVLVDRYYTYLLMNFFDIIGHLRACFDPAPKRVKVDTKLFSKSIVLINTYLKRDSHKIRSILSTIDLFEIFGSLLRIL